MGADRASRGDDMLSEALAAMQSALALLDKAGAPAQIGAHLDLAICQLQDCIESATDACPGTGLDKSVWSPDQP